MSEPDRYARRTLAAGGSERVSWLEQYIRRTKTDNRRPLPACQCVKWSAYNPCQENCTQEDFLCDMCRDGCGFLTPGTGNYDGEPVHIVPLDLKDLSRLLYG